LFPFVLYHKLCYLVNILIFCLSLFRFIPFRFMLYFTCLAFSLISVLVATWHTVTRSPHRHIYYREFLLPSHLFHLFYVLSLFILIIYSYMIHIEDNVSNKCGRGYYT